MQLCFAAILLSLLTFVVTFKDTRADEGKLKVPIILPEVTPEMSTIQLPDAKGVKHDLSLNVQMQAALSQFIRDRGNPIAAVVAIEVKTGRILAMAQGRDPKLWGGTSNSALHAMFPAASLFKTVVAGAAFDLSDIEPEVIYGLEGGCADVRPTGVWLNDQISSRNQMSLMKAYGNSCNGFFAKMGVNHLGLKTIVDYANRFGWDGRIQTDFAFEKSPLNAPSVRTSSVHAVGRFSAGFGAVGMSAVHAAWMMQAIANDGIKKPVYLLEESVKPVASKEGFSLSAINPDLVMISASAAKRLRNMMEVPVRHGTAAFAFKRGKYKKLRDIAGGKTGTLTGHTPYGVTTWFAGMMPVEDPQVVVAAVVVLENLWHIKAPNLAAEAFSTFDEFVMQKSELAKHHL